MRYRVYIGMFRRMFLYLRKYYGYFDEKFVQSIKVRYLEWKKRNIHTVSFLHLEIVKIMKELGIKVKIEENMFGIDIDIMIFDQNSDQPVSIVEIQGYQHFFRNSKEKIGSTYFKEKILKDIIGPENYFVIEIDNWSFLDNASKKRFIKELFSNYTPINRLT